MIYYPSNSRGYNKIDWLETSYSFSFADYHNPERMGFGALRVVNDDMVSPDKGFGMHSHHNMEIITIPLEGAVLHKDNIGNQGTITTGEVQVMSAGSGIRHAEYNASQSQMLKLLQIWIETDTIGAVPRYDQKAFNDDLLHNTFYAVVGPFAGNTPLHIHQNAWVNLGRFTQGDYEYSLKSPFLNGVFVFVIEGEIKVEHQLLQRRDALGFSEDDKVSIQVPQNAYVLLIEVPMM